MIKRTVGLRPIKYSKLPSDVTIGLFNDSVYERQSLSDAFSKLHIKPTFMDEKEIFAQWNGNQDIQDLDFVLLFSHIPHNELKDIWNITGCDQIIKFASFNRIYNQCVYGQDFLWINCNDVDSIEQKIRWDKITLSASSKLKKSESISPKETLKIGTPPNLPEEFTTVSVPVPPPRPIPEVIETKQESNPKIRKLVSENNIVNVTDIVNNEEHTWTVSLPKKVIILDEDVSQENRNLSDKNEDGSCNIL